MDSDRALRTEFRQALDDVLPPVPWLEAAVAKDLRKRRSSRSGNRGVDNARRVSVVPRHAMRLAVALLIVLFAAVAVATFVELRGHATQTSPAGMDQATYKAMIHRDLLRTDTAGDGSACATLESVCPAPGKPVQTALRRWLDDLDGSRPPTTFAVIDGQLRLHLAAQISMLDRIYAAYAARDDAALTLATYAGNAQGTWVGDLAQIILESRQETSSLYFASVRDANQTFNGCTPCQTLAAAGQSKCAPIDPSGCEIEVGFAMTAVEQFQASLVLHRAPSSLTAPDMVLQRDLGQADTALIAMATADLSANQVAFDTGRQLFARALLAMQSDVATVLGGQ